MFNAQALTEKWAPVLGHEGAGSIKDNYRKAVTAVLLENQERFMREERGMLAEAGGAAGNIAGAIGANGLSGSALGTHVFMGPLLWGDYPVVRYFFRLCAINRLPCEFCWCCRKG